MNLLDLPLWQRVSLFFVLLVLLAWALFAYRIEISQASIPWLHWIVDFVEQNYEIGEFNIVQKKTEWMYHLRLVTDHPVKLFNVTLPYMDVSGSTLLTHGLQHYFLVLAFLLGGLLFFPSRLLILIPCMALVLLISIAADIPFVLLGSIEGLILQNFAPDQLDQQWLVKWERFLTNGGRMAIPIGLSATVIALAQKT